MSQPLIYYATHRVHSPKPFPLLSDTATILSAIRTIADEGGWLSQAGWGIHMAGSTYATAGIWCPFGFSTNTDWCTVDGVIYQIVAPDPAGPQQAMPGAPVTIPLILNEDATVNQAATAANLALGVTMFSQWDATASGSGLQWNIAMVARDPGPLPNYAVIGSNGRWTTAVNNGGGGWQWLSAASPGAQQIAVSLHMGGVTPSLVLTVDYLSGLGSYSTTFFLGWRARWQFWANEYSFVFFVDPADDVSYGGWYQYNSFFWAGVPRHAQLTFGYVPEISYAFGTWQSRTKFSGGTNTATLLNGYFASGGDRGFDVLRSNSGTLVSRDGYPLLLQARCGMPQSGGEMRVVGWLYDALVATAQYPLPAFINYDGHPWMALLSTSAGATLFVRWE